MKKVLAVLSLAFLIFAQSCGQEPAETEKETTELPDPVSESYGTEWAYAGMDKQIPADDPDFSVTGAGFEYRDGWLGVEDEGYFDLTTVYDPGSDEKFTLEFDTFIKDGGVLWLGIWLYGKDSMPNDGIPGEWIKLCEDSAGYNGQTFAFDKKETVKIKLTAGPDGFAFSADGKELFHTNIGSQNGGGAIKLRSQNGVVYISNIAFRLGN